MINWFFLCLFPVNFDWIYFEMIVIEKIGRISWWIQERQKKFLANRIKKKTIYTNRLNVFREELLLLFCAIVCVSVCALKSQEFDLKSRCYRVHNVFISGCYSSTELIRITIQVDFSSLSLLLSCSIDWSAFAYVCVRVFMSECDLTREFWSS